MSEMENQSLIYDVVIVGGGMSGLCAALASARNGANTALVQNRPVLGGNASSEIRMHIVGASCHGTRDNSRETGIIEEILLENKYRNPQYSFSVFDSILWEKANYQTNLDLFLNTHMAKAVKENNLVKKIYAEQLTTEKKIEFEGKIFVDATGDATLAALVGADFMKGREGREVFGEKHAPEESDSINMGSTLLFSAIDQGRKIEFRKPEWAYSFSEEDLAFRNHDEITSGYWWIEIGGENLDIIEDAEIIRDELIKALYGVWDHIKNIGDHGAENLALDWVGYLPGKRESRRVVGDYVLKEHDIISGKKFKDAVAYGGWPIDIHNVGGIRTNISPTDWVDVDLYTIPYRCLYSRNFDNLFIAGRAISASRLAFSSTRVMGTCSVVGQAVGTASAYAIENNLTTKEVLNEVAQLQQKLLKDDCFIPGIKNNDPRDKAKNAIVNCSSSQNGAKCANVINGYSRNYDGKENCWISRPIKGEKIFDFGNQWLSLEFEKPQEINKVILKFDSNLSGEVMITLSEKRQDSQEKGAPKQLVKDYELQFYKEGNLIYNKKITDNYQRCRVHELDKTLHCDKIKLIFLKTHGIGKVRLFEVRIY